MQWPTSLGTTAQGEWQHSCRRVRGGRRQAGRNGAGHLSCVVGIHTVHADGQLGGQLGPDGLHKWLLAVPQYLCQACRWRQRGDFSSRLQAKAQRAQQIARTA